MPSWVDRPSPVNHVPVPAPPQAPPPEKSEWEKRCDRRDQEEIDQLAYFAKTQEATPTSFTHL